MNRIIGLIVLAALVPAGIHVASECGGDPEIYPLYDLGCGCTPFCYGWGYLILQYNCPGECQDPTSCTATVTSGGSCFIYGEPICDGACPNECTIEGWYNVIAADISSCFCG